MQKDHDHLARVIINMAEVGVKMSKTKSRLELLKVVEKLHSNPKSSGF